MAQLEQLNAMERHQDWITWTTNTVYTATNAALIASMVALLVQNFIYTSNVLIGLVLLIFGSTGAFISRHWFRIILRAHIYEITWLLRAKALQDEVKVPLKYRIWQESPPEGTPSWLSVSTVITAFFFAWVIIASVGISPLALSLSDYLTDGGEFFISFLVAVIPTIVLLALGVIVIFKSFFDAEEKFDSDKKLLEDQLGLTDTKTGVSRNGQDLQEAIIPKQNP